MTKILDEPRWRCDLMALTAPSTREKVGRLPTNNLKVTVGIGQPHALSMRVPNSHRHVREIAELSTFVKAYRLPAGADPADVAPVRFHGPVGPCADALGVDGACELSALSPWWYVMRRVRQSTRTWSTSTDKGDIVADLLDDEQARRALRIDTSAVAAVGSTLPAYETPIGSNVGEKILELANTGDGFEIDEQPIDSDTGNLASIELVDALGITNTDVFLEMELRKRNVATASLTSIVDRVATDLLAIGQATGAVENARDLLNPDLARDVYDALLDTVDTFGDIADVDALDALLEKLAFYRQAPRRLLTLAPKGNLEFRPWDDFNLGDLISVRTPDVGRLVVDGSVRVWGWTVAVSNEGEERLETLTIDPLGAV